MRFSGWFQAAYERELAARVNPVRFFDERPMVVSGFKQYLRGLDSNRYVVPGFTMKTTAAAELVIENAFDAAHFRTVHGILNEPRFRVEGTFTIPPSPWQKPGAGKDRLDVRYVATAFSPWIVVSVLEGPNPYYVITCATPSGGETTVRLSLIMPPDENGAAPSQTACQYLLKQSLDR